MMRVNEHSFTLDNLFQRAANREKHTGRNCGILGPDRKHHSLPQGCLAHKAQDSTLKATGAFRISKCVLRLSEEATGFHTQAVSCEKKWERCSSLLHRTKG